MVSFVNCTNSLNAPNLTYSYLSTGLRRCKSPKQPLQHDHTHLYPATFVLGIIFLETVEDAKLTRTQGHNLCGQRNTANENKNKSATTG